MKAATGAAAAWLALVAAAAPPQERAGFAMADAAGNRLVRFTRSERDGPPGAGYCTGDASWCARVRRDEAGHMRVEIGQGSGPIRQLELAGPEDEESEIGLWPSFFIEAGGAALIGVELTRSTGYSGGGAHGVRMVLVRAESGGGALQPVLDVPFAATRDLRACFASRDMRRRRHACSDQYQYFAGLLLDPTTRAGRPRLIYSSQAQTYPGRRTAESDSTTAPPLRRSDLRWWHDPACTFRRVFAFDAAAGRYLPDRPLPACADYLDF